MSEENHEIPTNEPQPIDTTEGWTILTKFGGAAIAVCGGFVAFAAFVAPTRTMGATCSGKLKWQQTNAQIEASAVANPAGLTNNVSSENAPASNAPSPLNDGRPSK